MGFFKKLKKLMCWRKRDKSRKKVRFAEIIEEVIGYSDEVESNTMGHAEEEPTNTGKDYNEDAVPILQEHIEELKKKLDERDGQIASLQKEFEEKECEMNEMEANFLTNRSGLVNTYRAERRDWKRVEEALRGQVKELKKKITGMDSDRGKLEEQIRIYRGGKCDLMRVEETLRGQVKELKKKIGRMESDSGTMEEQIRSYRAEKSDLMRVEKALRGQVKELKKKIARMDSDREEVEDTPKKLQEEGDLESMEDAWEIFWFLFKVRGYILNTRCFVHFVFSVYDFISSFF